jgi:hypothetical protein
MSDLLNGHFAALQAAVVARLIDPNAKDSQQQLVPFPTNSDGTVPVQAYSDSTLPTAAVQVLSEAKGDVADQLKKSMAGGGIAMIVLTPLGRFRQQGTDALDLLSPLQIQIQENVGLNQAPNGTRINALSLVVYAMKRLHTWPHPLYGAQRRPHKIMGQANPFTLLSFDAPELIYNVDFLAPINLNLPLAPTP